MIMSSSCWLMNIVLLSYISGLSADSHHDEKSSFSEKVNALNATCDAQPSCEGIISIKDTFCCGSCECDDNCFKYGSCCLHFYDNFTHARVTQENSRYSCVIPQYLPADKSDYIHDVTFWLITKCDKDYTNDEDISLCESPGSDYDTLVPVSEFMTNTNFKNKYCAYCNNVDRSTQLFNWKLQINSKQYISFPRRDLLDLLRKTKGNIFYRPPEYVAVQECSYAPEYSIATCNETGLWTKYDADIELACGSYLDPFNFTYKNFFCFLCNADESILAEDWECSTQYQEPGEPDVSGLYDMEFIVKGNSEDSLICDGNQFADEKMMVCREVFCAQHHELEVGRCRVYVEPLNETCYTVFIKLTPLSGQTAQRLDAIDQTNLVDVIQARLKSLSADNATPLNDIPRSLTMFYKTNVTGYVEYAVTSIDSIFPTCWDLDDFLIDLMLLQNEVLYYNNDVLGFSVELAKYNLTVFGLTAKLLVPNLVDNSYDELVAELLSFDDTICFATEPVQLSKLYVCPYIELRIGEIPVKSDLDFLFFTDPFSDNTIIKNLSRWEFERQDENIKICLKDYLIMANAITSPQANTLSSAKTFSINRFPLCSFIIFHILKSLLQTLAANS